MPLRRIAFTWVVLFVAFIAMSAKTSRAELRYNVTVLRSIYAATIAYADVYAIADDGLAVGQDGSYYVDSAPYRAATWDAQGDPTILAVPEGTRFARAIDISDSGFVIGRASVVSSTGTSIPTAPYRWQGLTAVTLGTSQSGLQSDLNIARPRVDRVGRMVAEMRENLPIGGVRSSVRQYFDDGTTAPLGPTSGNVWMRGLNDEGLALIKVSGASGYANGVYTVTPDGTMSVLPTQESVVDINDHEAVLHFNGVLFADGSTRPISLPGRNPFSLNDRGDAVGWYSAFSGQYIEQGLAGFALVNGETIKLSERIPSGWLIRRAYDINNRGQIVGYGILDHDLNPATPPQRHAVRLDPIRTPGDTNYDDVVDFNDLLTLAQHYGQSGNGNVFYETGDFNFDWAVNFDDLLTLSQNYSTAGQFEADWAFARSIVPEPASIALLLCIPRRRRA